MFLFYRALTQHCYVRLLWSVIFELYKIICAFLPLYLFLIKRKNYPTVNGLCFTLWNNVLRTIICPWISLRRFNIEGRPSSFWAGALKFDLDKVILKNAHISFFRPSLGIHIRRITLKFPFRCASNDFCKLSYSSSIT